MYEGKQSHNILFGKVFENVNHGVGVFPHYHAPDWTKSTQWDDRQIIYLLPKAPELETYHTL